MPGRPRHGLTPRTASRNVEPAVGHGTDRQRQDDGQLELFDASVLTRGPVRASADAERPDPTDGAETEPGPAADLRLRRAGREWPPHPTTRPTTQPTTHPTTGPTTASPGDPRADGRGATVSRTPPVAAVEAIGADEVATLFEMVGHERDVVSRLWRCVDDLRTVQSSKDALAALQPTEVSRALDRRRLRLLTRTTRPIDPDPDLPRALDKPERPAP